MKKHERVVSKHTLSLLVTPTDAVKQKSRVLLTLLILTTCLGA